MGSARRGENASASFAAQRRAPLLLRGLARFDAWIGALEAALLTTLLLALAAGAMAQILVQNAGPRGGEVVRVGLLAAGFGLPSAGILRALAARRRGVSTGTGKALLAGGFLLLVAGALSVSSVLDYLLRAGVLWIGLLGASLATRRRGHITIEVLERFLPPRWRRVSAGATSLAALAILAVLLVVSVEYVAESRARAEVFFVHRETDSAFPASWVKAVLPLGLGLMAWRFALFSCEALWGVDLLPRRPAEGAAPAGMAAPSVAAGGGETPP